MVADKGKKPKIGDKIEEEQIDGELVLSIEKLQEVQDELEKINEEASDKVLEVEQKYNEVRKPVYDKRSDIIKSIPDFWLTAFLSHPVLSDLLSEEDQKQRHCSPETLYGGERMETAGQWLEKALLDLCRKTEGLDLDGDLISGLVSYCDLAPPLDAKEYLDNIVGEEAGRHVIDEYLKRRGYMDTSSSSLDGPTTQLREYVKPPAKEPISATKKPVKAPKEATASTSKEKSVPTQITQLQNPQTGNQSKSRKKKSGKVVSLAEASKGSIIFQTGKPCSCQARRHRLVSNCLSCGKIVCEQEGEGPCSFCGALVLREGSTYAGLEEDVMGPLSDAEAAAEAYAKRLVDYDRNSAARTTVIDDQSDYYEIEGNSWLSMEEKELLTKKKEEIEEAERANRNKVVISFDLVGRKVLLNEDEALEQLQKSILLKPADEREANRIKPNPTLEVQPIFIDPGPSKKNANGKINHVNKGLCLEISGRVQHDATELKHHDHLDLASATKF